MTGNINVAESVGIDRAEDALHPEKHVPILELRVFGGFDAFVDGRPIESRYSRQRRIQSLLSILALNHGQELYSDYLADSIWPRSSDEKKRHCFHNLWYLTTHAVYEGKREDNPYFERRAGTCRLLDAYVRTDVEAVERACDDLMRRDLDPVHAYEAYRRLQRSYRGDLLPGETENAIIIRARADWHERVSGALSAAAHQMADCGEDRAALWLATAAFRLSGMREDVARLRMELFTKMGMRAYAVRAYNELEDYLQDEVGIAPSPQSMEVIQHVVDAGDLGRVLAPKASTRRRRPGREEPADQRKKAEMSLGSALPAPSGFPGQPM